jgi:hypothetical protein
MKLKLFIVMLVLLAAPTFAYDLGSISMTHTWATDSSDTLRRADTSYSEVLKYTTDVQNPGWQRAGWGWIIERADTNYANDSFYIYLQTAWTTSSMIPNLKPARWKTLSYGADSILFGVNDTARFTQPIPVVRDSLREVARFMVIHSIPAQAKASVYHYVGNPYHFFVHLYWMRLF